MNNNAQGNEPNPSEDFGRRDERRHRERNAGGWAGGAVLIVIGIIILMQNFGRLYLNNWWALFILIPALGAFGNAWRSYQDAGGRLSSHARGSLIGGLVLSMITAIFLFNLSWTILGPTLIILAGVGILINAVLPS
jgi:hypothetical protein